MLLRPCYLPASVKSLEPQLQQRFKDLEDRKNWPAMSVEQSWSSRPQLQLEGPRLVQAVQQHLVNHKRQVTEQHFLPMSPLQREACLKTNNIDQLLSNSALVDDVVVSSKDINTKEYQSLSETDQLRVHLQIHIFALETLFHAISQLSRPPGPGPIFHASVKLKLEKSSLGATSLRYLNTIYISGFKVIQLEAFKKSSPFFQTLPQHGDDLRSALGFFNFLLGYVKNLRFFMSKLENFLPKSPSTGKNHRR